MMRMGASREGRARDTRVFWSTALNRIGNDERSVTAEEYL